MNRLLYKRVIKRLRQEVAAYQPGDRLPGEKEWAKRFRVSMVTLREAMLLLCHEGTVERRQGSGCYVSKAPPNRWVAVLCPYDLAVPNLSFGVRRMFQQVRRELAQADVPTRGYVGFGDPSQPSQVSSCPELLDDIVAGRVSGVLTVQGTTPSAVRACAEERGLLVVDTNEYGPHRMVCEIVRQGVSWLTAQGCTRIGILAWIDPLQTLPGVDVAGVFREELAKAGLTYIPQWSCTDLHPNRPGAGWEGIHEIWQARREKPNGLLITDDVLASDAAIGIVEHGIRVPADMKVISQTNKGANHWLPFPYERIEVDTDYLARFYVQQMLNQLDADAAKPDPIDIQQAVRSMSSDHPKDPLQVSPAKHAVGHREK